MTARLPFRVLSIMTRRRRGRRCVDVGMNRRWGDRIRVVPRMLHRKAGERQAEQEHRDQKEGEQPFHENRRHHTE